MEVENLVGLSLLKLIFFPRKNTVFCTVGVAPFMFKIKFFCHVSFLAKIFPTFSAGIKLTTWLGDNGGEGENTPLLHTYKPAGVHIKIIEYANQSCSTHNLWLPSLVPQMDLGRSIRVHLLLSNVTTVLSFGGWQVSSVIEMKKLLTHPLLSWSLNQQKHYLRADEQIFLSLLPVLAAYMHIWLSLSR